MKKVWVTFVLAAAVVACTPDVDRGDSLDAGTRSMAMHDLAVHIESDHPYANNSRQVYEVSVPEGARNVTIHFDRLRTEPNYDYVLVYDADGHFVRALTGNQDGASVLVNTPGAYIMMYSDSSVTDYGFVVSRISYLGPAPAPHKPECRAIGTRSEGWYWADTGELIKYANCADAGEPQCGAIGSRSEGWSAEGYGFITWDNCHRTVGIAIEGEECNEDYRCVMGTYCASDGVCHRDGQCVVDDDCSNGDNPWVHPLCTGYATCEDGACVWHCSAPDPQPSDPVPAAIGEKCETRMPEGDECVEEGYCASDGVCHEDGKCVVTDDCLDPNNVWVHVMCTGYAACEEGTCVWHCSAPDPQPSDPVPAAIGEACETRMPAGDECVEEGYCASDGICHADGECVVDEDCARLGNTWFHPECVGTAYCNQGTCAWECSADPIEPEPVWSWTTIMASGIESDHPYPNDYTHTWTIHRDGAAKIKLHFEKIDIEEGYDYLVIRGTDPSERIVVDGYYEDAWTGEFSGDTVYIELHTDYSVAHWGFRVDFVSYYEQLPQGRCNTDDDCPSGQTCHPVQCINPYEACYGECRAN